MLANTLRSFEALERQGSLPHPTSPVMTGDRHLGCFSFQRFGGD
jgi:hypothetical protein